MRAPRKPLGAVLLTVVLGLTLSGCGGSAVSPAKDEGATTTPTASTSSSSPSSSPSPAANAAKGPRFSGPGYSFHVPKGWRDATKAAKGLNKMVDVAAAAKPDNSGFASNVNVVVANAGVDEPTSAQMTIISNAIRNKLKPLVPRLRVNPITEVAGQKALNHEGPADKSGVKYYINQYVAFKDGKAYTITFSYGRTKSLKERRAIQDSILASWTWS